MVVSEKVKYRNYQQTEQSYRQGVEQDPEEQDHKHKKNYCNENPFESAPNYEFHGLAGVCKPEE